MQFVTWICRPHHGTAALAICCGGVLKWGVLWISDERLADLLNDAGHLTGAPELAIEVLSFGGQNEARDRTAKRKLYETQGVRAYWILDWRLKQVEVYRRDQGELRRVATLLPEDTLTTPLLSGFACAVARLFN